MGIILYEVLNLFSIRNVVIYIFVSKVLLWVRDYIVKIYDVRIKFKVWKDRS